jgi:hypothetical protein
MSRFNKLPAKTHGGTPIATAKVATGTTGNGAPGFARDAKSELFLLAVSNFVGQDAFYEKAKQRDDRFVELIYAVADQDPGWLKRFLPWLRKESNMRTASIIGAVEAARAFVDRKIPGGRQLVASVLQRADEPGEALGYYMSTYGRKVPKPIKRGIADATQRLYNEYGLLKYDTASHAFRFGDVLELTHAKTRGPWQSHLYKHAIDRRHNRDEQDVSQLPMVQANMAYRAAAAVPLSQQPESLLDADKLKAAGFTWEDALSLLGGKVAKQRLWEAMIPNMGVMALIRNLRNFDQAGVSDAVAQQVLMKLQDPEQVARSRQLPMRFLTAYRHAPSLRWSYPLEQALEWSLQNVPQFKGRTLILIDTSSSMNSGFSKDGELRLWDAAAMFGLAVAKRCDTPTVISFSNSSKPFHVDRSRSLLKLVEDFRVGYFYGGGTATEAAVRQWYDQHDRVLILTDEQANHHGRSDVAASVPKHIPVITFNLDGYKFGQAPGSGTRITIGGLTDQAFKLIPILESRAAGNWPF